MKAKIILALDVDSFSKAKYFVNKLYPKIKIFKVGLQLFSLCGPKIVELIHKKGADVFLDLKLFDIPNTVAGAVRSAARLRVKMLSLHILGGQEMLKAAIDSAKKESRRLKIKPPLLIGVTVLTSKETKEGEVLKLVRLGINCGLDGVVCSVKEAVLLRRQIKKKFFMVTPGIRLNKISRDDQKRTATPGEAIKAGADFLVIGRPILEAKDPPKIVKELIYGIGKYKALS